MYCKHCGQEINDNAAVCIHCGCAVSNAPAQTQNSAATKGESKTGMGILLGLLLGFIGLIYNLCNPINPFGGSVLCQGLASVSVVVKAAVPVLVQVAEQCPYLRFGCFLVNDVVFLTHLFDDAAHTLHSQVKTRVRYVLNLQQRGRSHTVRNVIQ